MTEWEFYRNGKIVPITEDEARHTFDRWGVLSDDRGMACLMHDQLWAEIDRLRDELVARDRRAPAAIGPDPEDEAMVAKLAHALACAPFDGDYDAVPPDEVFRRVRYAHLKFMYERQAKAVLTALRDAARGAGG